MCTGTEGAAALNTTQQVQLGATAFSGISQALYHDTQRIQANADAAAERDVAQQQAERILRATARRRSEARAATAASGARVDQFALGVEQDIVGAGEHDAAMVILGGERRAGALRTQGRMSGAASMNALAGSLFEGSYKLSGWRGARGPAYSYNDDISGERYSSSGEAIRGRR